MVNPKEGKSKGEKGEKGGSIGDQFCRVGGGGLEGVSKENVSPRFGEDNGIEFDKDDIRVGVFSVGNLGDRAKDSDLPIGNVRKICREKNFENEFNNKINGKIFLAKKC